MQHITNLVLSSSVQYMQVLGCFFFSFLSSEMRSDGQEKKSSNEVLCRKLRCQSSCPPQQCKKHLISSSSSSMFDTQKIEWNCLVFAEAGESLCWTQPKRKACICAQSCLVTPRWMYKSGGWDGCVIMWRKEDAERENKTRGEQRGKKRMEECAAALDRPRPLFETTFHECLLCAIIETQQAIIAIQYPVVLKSKVAFAFLFCSFFFFLAHAHQHHLWHLLPCFHGECEWAAFDSFFHL